MNSGYIYLIFNTVGELGGYKIGKTINPARRFKSLKVGSKAKLIQMWYLENYSQLERRLHKMFAHLRVPQSEWFALKPADIKDMQYLLDRGYPLPPNIYNHILSKYTLPISK